MKGLVSLSILYKSISRGKWRQIAVTLLIILVERQIDVLFLLSVIFFVTLNTTQGLIGLFFIVFALAALTEALIATSGLPSTTKVYMENTSSIHNLFLPESYSHIGASQA